MATAAPQSTIDIGRVISKGFDALLKNAVPFFGVAFVLAGLPALLLQWWIMSSVNAAAANPEALAMSGGFWFSAGLSFIVSIITSALLQGILVRSTILYLGGRPVDIGHSVSVALGLILPIIGLSILLAIIIGIGLVLLIVPGVILALMLCVSVPALVEERQGVFASMSRSNALTSGSKLMIFVLMIIYVVFLWVIGLIIGLIFGGGAAVTGSYLFASIGQAISSTISSVVAATMVSSLYVELRGIKEGATPDSMAQVFA